MEIAEIKKEKKHLCRLVFTDGKEVLIDTDVCNDYCLKAGDILSEMVKIFQQGKIKGSLVS